MAGPGAVSKFTAGASEECDSAGRAPRVTSPLLSVLVAIRARARGGQLDRAIASGRAPATDPVFARRALQLTGARTRSRLATSLEAVIAEAHDPRGSASAVPVNRRAVLAAQAELRGLISHLRNPGTVSARGVAIVRCLLTDGTSPLYGHAPHTGLADAAAEAATAMRPRSTGVVPHSSGDDARHRRTVA